MGSFREFDLVPSLGVAGTARIRISATKPSELFRANHGFRIKVSNASQRSPN